MAASFRTTFVNIFSGVKIVVQWCVLMQVQLPIDDLASNRRQAITRTNDDKVLWPALCVFNFIQVDPYHCHKYFVFPLHDMSDYIMVSIMAISLFQEYVTTRFGYS